MCGCLCVLKGAFSIFMINAQNCHSYVLMCASDLNSKHNWYEFEIRKTVRLIKDKIVFDCS